MDKTLVVRFRIGGNLRFLSHHETVSMFQRALSRAAIKVCYSEGFNPRPKVSLPLPRSVGVESEDELLYGRVSSDELWSGEEGLNKHIRSQLPQDCEIMSVEVIEQRVSYEPVSVVYVFTLGDLAGDEEVKVMVDGVRRAISGDEELIVERQASKGKGIRKIDVGRYINTIEYKEGTVAVKCNITPSGTVRIDEILQLLQIDRRHLSVPVKRKSVEWSCN